MKHNPMVVNAFFKSYGIPAPVCEYQFHESRKWRFDYSWQMFVHKPHEEYQTNIKLALEVDGAVWQNGRHTRGSGYVKDMEKFNEAAALGWRVIKVQPKDLLTKATADLIRKCLCLL